MWYKVTYYWKKILATGLATGFFLFFWINGPINQQINSLLVSSSLSKFSIPKLIGGKKEVKNSGLITKSTKINTHTNWLQSEQKPVIKSSGLVSSKVSNQIRTQQNQALKFRAQELFKLDSTTIEMVDNYVISPSIIYFESSPNHDHIMGYAGPIKIGVALNTNNSIHKVYLINSDETESYLRKIQRAGYYQQFNKLVFNKGTQQIDGVSGATITSQAIGKIVEGMVEEISINQPIYASTESEPFTLEVHNSLIWILHISLILTLFIYGYQSKFKKSKKSMLILGFLSVLYIGFFLNNSFTYISFIEPFVGSSLSAFAGIYAFAALISAIWGNNTYCKFVCPFGHVQRLAIKIPFIKQYKLPVANIWAQRTRSVITIALIAGILVGVRQWKNYEVFPAFFGVELASISFITAFLILIISAVYPMFWCRVACPTGCVLDTVKKITK